MDKKELRRQIREQKRAMTEEAIVEASARLGELFLDCPEYKAAKTIYGYLPYNQEVRTVPMLEQALKDGKRVAVPKCYGDEMKFIYMDDLSFEDNELELFSHSFVNLIAFLLLNCPKRLRPCPSIYGWERLFFSWRSLPIVLSQTGLQYNFPP